METLLQLLGVFALSLVELWAAVPAGVALGLPPILVWLATVAGAMACIVIVVLAGAHDDEDADQGARDGSQPDEDRRQPQGHAGRHRGPELDQAEREDTQELEQRLHA